MRTHSRYHSAADSHPPPMPMAMPIPIANATTATIADIKETPTIIIVTTRAHAVRVG